MLSSLFGYDNRIGTMPCIEAITEQGYRERHVELDGFQISSHGISFDSSKGTLTNQPALLNIAAAICRSSWEDPDGTEFMNHSVSASTEAALKIGSPSACATTHLLSGPIYNHKSSPVLVRLRTL